MKKVKKLLNSKKGLSGNNHFLKKRRLSLFLVLKKSKKKSSKLMQPLLHYIEGINRDESIGTVLFDSKKFKKTIKLNESGQKEPTLVIFSLKLI